jgi:Exo-beta-D-glucosaminidase Ig-fold domain/Glycosyl hydrolases family 2/F5/8 type C domain/Glycosyl hydrolases family 2, sugar binding domain
LKPAGLLFFAFLSVTAAFSQQYTRGLGVYPGDPRQYDGPSLTVDTTTYRNLALHRPAYQSSAYDYNLTAQLVTDGIKEHDLPLWVVTSTSDRGELPKNERGVFLDGNVVSSINVGGDHPWVELDIEGGGAPPQIDHVDVSLRKIYAASPTDGWNIVVSGSNDRTQWKEVGRFTGIDFPGAHDPGPGFTEPIQFSEPVNFRDYRVEFSAAGVKSWGVGDLKLLNEGREVHVAGPEVFSSAWMSAGSGEEWVSIDLGATCAFDRVVLAWVRRAAAGAIQASNDGAQWNILQALPNSNELQDDIHLDKPVRARWVRVLMTRPAETNGHYILSEMEVYGRGGPVPKPKSVSMPRADGALRLSGGKWRVQRASLVQSDGAQVSKPGFADTDWMVATVPGTVLTSYLNDGAIADPNFGDNQYAVSDSFFCADFWYRDEFVAPAAKSTGQHLWLNFDGINWKAEVYLNGEHVGRIDGGFMRGRFDVTTLVHRGAVNALAVRIISNANPGGTKDKAGDTVNGGALGLDNPTYHASAGWDWMSTIRGRNDGIWSNVTLTTSGAVTIENPLISSTLPLPDTSSSDVSIEATLRNHEARAVSGTLRATFGTISVQQQVTLDPSSTKAVKFGPATQAALHLEHPKLWWPVGYGDPNLYPVTISFTTNGKVTDAKSFKAGLRQFTYSEDGGVLKIWINGRRFIARGGNWGFPESMLRYRAREYDTAMRYHRDQHFNMVRNWVGQTGDEELYDAADRFGVVLWQDFWLANPWDGPNPDDNNLFLTNARDYLLRIRNHASLGLFCGRNEGNPPPPIDDGLRAMVAELEPNSHFISSSADGPVSGHGPYRVQPLKKYFIDAPTKMHSEMGSPNVPEMEIMRHTLSEDAMWPIGPPWRVHDFHSHNPFADAVEQSYGGAKNADEFVSLSQFVNYNAYRGMFEGQSKNRLGLLIWMSHPAWPSILWQTYDYFFDTDAAYYAAKKAAEPLHIQWNAATDAVEVVNYNAGDQLGLTARAEVLDIDGKVRWQKSASLDSHEDSTLSPIQIEYPAGLARTHFIRLKLLHGDAVISSNFYWHGTAEEDYTGLRTLGPAHVVMQTHTARVGSQWKLVAELSNTSSVPALMVRVKAVRDKSGDIVAPALYDDNYVALMPGERKTIHIELEDADTRGEHPRVVLQGYNLEVPSRLDASSRLGAFSKR